MTLMRLNPELQRCLWLELTPTRLVLMPVLVVLLFGGLRLAEFRAMDDAFSTAMFALLVLWGSRLAADAFAEELVERTWDVQRLSAANPWGLTLGKLLGGTAYAWYGAGLSLLGYLAWGNPASHDLGPLELSGMVAAGLVAQSASLLTVLAFHRFEGGGRRRGALTIAQLVGIAAALGLWFGVVAGSRHGIAIEWYGMQIGMRPFTLATQGLLAVWFVVGAAFLIRRDLGERNSPAPWLAFYAYGLVIGLGVVGSSTWRIPPYVDGYGLPAMGLATMQGAGLAYVALLSSPLSVVEFKRLGIAMSSRRWAEAWTLLPAFVPLAALTILSALAVVLMDERGQGMVIGWIGIMLRDFAIVVWVRLAAQRRTTLLLGVVAALLYGLLPYVLRKVGGPEAGGLLLPGPTSGLGGLVGPWLMAVVATGLAWRQWSRLVPQ